VHTLISTDVAARGIDVPDIASVVHADLPEDAEGLIHRSGRTGRAGRKGTSSLLIPLRAERRARELLRAAKLEALWSEIPTPAMVHKQWVKQTRRALHAELERADGLTDAELSYAAKLLDGREPARLIATLLRMAGPELPREPIDPGPAPRARFEHGQQARFEQGGRTSERAPREDRRSDDFVDFEINWGHRGGATPARILAHLCRRGEISSRQIGAVRIDRGSTRFGIVAEAAEEFARKAAKPDKRDPKLRIQPVSDRAPARMP
jgi:ATP-dependent RNA helicase DeaD